MSFSGNVNINVKASRWGSTPNRELGTEDAQDLTPVAFQQLEVEMRKEKEQLYVSDFHQRIQWITIAKK